MLLVEERGTASALEKKRLLLDISSKFFFVSRSINESSSPSTVYSSRIYILDEGCCRLFSRPVGLKRAERMETRVGSDPLFFSICILDVVVVGPPSKAASHRQSD